MDATRELTARAVDSVGMEWLMRGYDCKVSMQGCSVDTLVATAEDIPCKSTQVYLAL
jgi:hypothetical protein